MDSPTQRRESVDTLALEGDEGARVKRARFLGALNGFASDWLPSNADTSDVTSADFPPATGKALAASCLAAREAVEIAAAGIFFLLRPNVVFGGRLEGGRVCRNELCCNSDS